MMIEIVAKRQENSKTFQLDGGKRQLVISMGAIHYRDNYASNGWEDIDLTWKDNKITKAPYELTRDGNKYTIRNKKTGEVSTIELLTSTSNFNIIPDYTNIKFQHIADTLPFEAQFKVTGEFRTRAYDDGELELETSLIDGVLTERITEVRDKHTKEIRPLKDCLKIDPTWQVSASTDDCQRRLTSSYWNLTETDNTAGAATASLYQYGCGMRFLNITIPQAATIDTAKLTLRASTGRSGTVCRTRISAEDVDDAVTFADDSAAFDTRWAARTTTRVDWDGIAGWTGGVDYDSPEIKTVIQEIVDRGSWASGQDMVIFWEDFEDRSDHGSDRERRAVSYDQSSANAPKLVVTYTEAGWSGGDVNGVAIGTIAEINSVALADIQEVNGVS